MPTDSRDLLLELGKLEQDVLFGLQHAEQLKADGLATLAKLEAVTGERDDARAALERLEQLLEAVLDVHPGPSVVEQLRALRDRLDGLEAERRLCWEELAQQAGWSAAERASLPTQQERRRWQAWARVLDSTSQSPAAYRAEQWARLAGRAAQRLLSALELYELAEAAPALQLLLDRASATLGALPDQALLDELARRGIEVPRG